MEFNTYAPVSIPTLNRYEHFKRCLESLERCTGADKTEIYVGLDYPPSEKYVDGWKKIDAYLAEKEKKNGFKNLIVFRRERNYGIHGPMRNSRVLRIEIEKKYDRYIHTEDDNEFSPNFLEFMNWGFETYKDDPSVIAICGYNELPVDFLKDNVFKHIWYNAWGVGRWLNKWQTMVKKVCKEEYSREYIKKCPLSLVLRKNMWELKNANSVIESIKTHRYHGDNLPYRQRNPILYSIHPKISMVRNWGADGSGQHGSSITRHQEQLNKAIDSSSHFVPTTSELIYTDELQAMHRKYYKLPFSVWCYDVVNFLSFKLTGKGCGSSIKRFYTKHLRHHLKKQALSN